MGQIIQGPLLMINMVILALPTLSQALGMFSDKVDFLLIIKYISHKIKVLISDFYLL